MARSELSTLPKGSPKEADRVTRWRSRFILVICHLGMFELDIVFMKVGRPAGGGEQAGRLTAGPLADRAVWIGDGTHP